MTLELRQVGVEDRGRRNPGPRGRGGPPVPGHVALEEGDVVAARREGLQQRPIGRGMAVAPGRGQAEAQHDQPQGARLMRTLRSALRGQLGAQQGVHLGAALRIGVFAPGSAGAAASPMARARRRVERRADGRPPPRRRGPPGPPSPGSQEQLDALPGVGDQAGAGAGRLEHPRRGRKADLRHASRGPR